MNCNDASRWIWEVLEAPSILPEDLQAHVRDCTRCDAQYVARRGLDQDLKDLRAVEQEEPSEAVNRRVLSGMAERSAPSSSQQAPALGIVRPQSGSASAAPANTPLREAIREHSPVLALAAALCAALLLGFSLGQSRLGPPLPASSEPSLQRYPRSHHVELSARAIESLEEGNTYMLIGPRGGPYQVIDVTTWDRVESVGPTVAGRDELVLAVGPAGGWSRGKTLLLGDLAGSGTEILARRALKH